MAQVKISALTAADPLTGVEEAPFVQGGATKKATAEQIRAYVASQPNVFSVTQRIEDAAPALQFSENDTVDQNWEFIGVAGALRLDELNDAFSTTGTHHTFTHGGGTQFGSPTGGDQGAGTVNATGLYENGNGVAKLSGGADANFTAMPQVGGASIGPPLSTSPYCTDSGSADSYVLSVDYSPAAPSAYNDGDNYRFRAGAANTGASTVNIDSVGVKPIVTVTGVALPSGYIRTDVDTTITYDSSNDWFVARREVEKGSSGDAVYYRYENGAVSLVDAAVAPGASGVTYTLPITMANADYFASCILAAGNENDAFAYPDNGSKTTTSFDIFKILEGSSYTGSFLSVNIQVEGEWY